VFDEIHILFHFNNILKHNGMSCTKIKLFFFRHDTYVFFSYTTVRHVLQFLSVTTGGFIFSVFFSKESNYPKQQGTSYLIFILLHLLEHRKDSEYSQPCLTSFNALTFCTSYSIEFPLYEGNFNVLSSVEE